MKSSSLSDRERRDLRGLVKTVTDEWSTTVFDRDGKTLEWRGNTSHGPSERTYSYNDNGRLIRISGSSGDFTDEFHYDEQDRMTRIRHVPARLEQQSRAFGVAAWFDAACEGEMLTDGGTVETTHNDLNEPVETTILDDEGLVLSRITYTYDADGRLNQEKLTAENPALPRAFREQIPVEHRAAALEQMKAQFAELSQRTGLFGEATRTYVYDQRGRLAERHMRRGTICEDILRSYNDQGDVVEQTWGTRGFPAELGVQTEQQLKWAYSYEYDSYGNWVMRHEASQVGGNTTTRSHVRNLTYYS